MKKHEAPPTAAELSKAYRIARLRMLGIGLHRALNTPPLYRALCTHVKAMRASDALITPIKEIA